MKTIIKTGIVIATSLLLITHVQAQTKLLPKLKKYSDQLLADFDKIPAERQDKLKEIGDYILATKAENKPVSLTFICTHNSRRSQMGQAWAKAAASYYGIDNIQTYSGGTSSTAFNERSIRALKKAGFNITKSGGTTENPNYMLEYEKESTAILMYSKKYSDKQNPQSEFGAIMVCSEADKSCPMVEGANKRISLPYDDPKFYDNTPAESAKYDERCKNIATEMFFVFDYVKKQLILVQEAKK
ncbi:MAG: protein-tyrosine-phosphatase [Bacteroidota bacterium]|nr:protein-tyrosine-phosphatase [Bacteroidota bacterium]